MVTNKQHSFFTEYPLQLGDRGYRRRLGCSQPTPARPSRLLGVFPGSWASALAQTHQADYARLQNRLDAMYVDKLDGRIDMASFDRMASAWRSEQADCCRLIAQHEAANQSYMAEGVRLLELARNARTLFEKQEAREKRRLLDFLVSNCSWKGGQLTAEFRQPFDSLADTAMAAANAAAANESESAKSEIWLLR